MNMTIRRSSRSPEDVLYSLASSYPGGVEAVASRLGISPRVLYKKLSASVQDRAVTVSEFSQIIHIAQDANQAHATEALQALCFRHGGVFVPIEDFDHISDECLYKGVSQVMAEIGSFAGKLDAGLEDGALSEEDMEKLEPQARTTFAVMARLWARIKGRMKRDASKPRRSIFSCKEKVTP